MSDLGQLNGAPDHVAPWEQLPSPARDNRFRPGRGGKMTQEWADHMLNQWWAARDKKLTFAEALKTTVLHFMNEPQP